MGSKATRSIDSAGSDHCRRLVAEWLSRDLRKLMLLSFSYWDIENNGNGNIRATLKKSGRKLFI